MGGLTLQQPNIVECLGWQINAQKDMEILMGLKRGSVAALLHTEKDLKTLADVVFRDMLQALDYVACKGFIHRDVKPANILFMLSSARYHFQLADFGLAEETAGTASHSWPRKLS
jgi:serine/threonine protein kinase